MNAKEKVLAMLSGDLPVMLQSMLDRNQELVREICDKNRGLPFGNPRCVLCGLKRTVIHPVKGSFVLGVGSVSGGVQAEYGSGKPADVGRVDAF